VTLIGLMNADLRAGDQRDASLRSQWAVADPRGLRVAGVIPL